MSLGLLGSNTCAQSINTRAGRCVPDSDEARGGGGHRQARCRAGTGGGGGGPSGQTGLGSSPLPDSFSWGQGDSSSIQEIPKSVLDPKSILKTFFEYN